MLILFFLFYCPFDSKFLITVKLYLEDCSLVLFVKSKWVFNSYFIRFSYLFIQTLYLITLYFTFSFSLSFFLPLLFLSSPPVVVSFKNYLKSLFFLKKILHNEYFLNSPNKLSKRKTLYIQAPKII